ncbi:hypothetical protein J4209_01315 [Candidatus Woesearchaeota archaeon]|nr:hypothetical protein [Candidatus Woesearchaeota archaeon]
MKIRKIKDFIGTLMVFLAVIFLLGLIFVPLQYFSSYATFIFNFFLIVLPIYLVAEIYYFVKDTPKRRESQKKEKTRKEKIISAVEWVFVGILLITLLLARNGTILKKECPETIQGNPNAELKIKYFFNPFCPSCWNQEIIVQNALEKYGERIRLERYDYRYCNTIGNQLGLMHMPAFSFEIANKTNNFGSLSDEKLSNIICDNVKC